VFERLMERDMGMTMLLSGLESGASARRGDGQRVRREWRMHDGNLDEKNG
jgi:hypothetical protein